MSPQKIQSYPIFKKSKLEDFLYL